MSRKQNALCRLNKAVASTGFCSRRRADDLIRSGLVMVNGEIARDFNLLVDFSKDKLAVDGVSLSPKSFDYVMLHKPPGFVTTSHDELGRVNVLELLPHDLRHLKPVGRLDLPSEGLLILTNDGALAYELTHPSKTVLKNYEVAVSGKITDKDLDELRHGIMLGGVLTHPAKVQLLERNKQLSKFKIAIHEGRNRQVRRMCRHLGYPVLRLIRVSIGRLQLEGLESGHWRHLTKQEIAALYQDS